jgi:acetyltransferase-like isoleucine patch superfamily enzyme
MSLFRTTAVACSAFLPWSIKRWFLQSLCGFQLDKSARIGIAFVLPGHLIMEAGARIGNLTVIKNLDLVHLKANATVGRGNWITGFPTGTDSPFFAHQVGRKAELIVEEHGAITNRHLIDCTSSVTIGRFTTFAGFQSQILTHSIDIEENRQSSKPVRIGEYCFVGTNCVILGGSVLPDKSVLAAKSLLTKEFGEPYTIYGGIPAKPLKTISRDAKYFHRSTGKVE